jgi:hypothetical protein
MIEKLEKLKDRLTGEKMLTTRLLVIFTLATLANILGCAFAYATAHKMLAWVVCLGFFLPVINFTISLLFLEARTLKERLCIMLVNSVALSIGGGLVSLYFE